MARSQMPVGLKARALQWLAQREQSRAELRRKLMPYARDEEARELEAALSNRHAGPKGDRPVVAGTPGSGEACFPESPKTRTTSNVPDVPGVPGGPIVSGAVDLPVAARSRVPDVSDRPDPSTLSGLSSLSDLSGLSDLSHASSKRAQPLGRRVADAAESTTDIPTAQARVEATLDWLQVGDYLSQERFVESRVHARSARFGNLRIRQELAQHGVAVSTEAAQSLRDSEWARAQDVWARKYADAAPPDAAAQARQARFLIGRGFTPEVVWRVIRQARSVVAGSGNEPPEDG